MVALGWLCNARDAVCVVRDRLFKEISNGPGIAKVRGAPLVRQVYECHDSATTGTFEGVSIVRTVFGKDLEELLRRIIIEVKESVEPGVQPGI